jgi:uncharacterized protein YidB (DUF937 family)
MFYCKPSFIDSFKSVSSRENLSAIGSFVILLCDNKFQPFFGDNPMSILDLVTGFLAQGNASANQQSPMTQVLASLLADPTGQQQNGLSANAAPQQQGGGLNMAHLAAGAAGVMALVNMFKTSGLGDQVQSWMSTGPNQAVAGADMTKVFGQERMAQIAQMLGVQPQQASEQLAEHLPNLIDKITPNGQLPQGGEQLAELAKQFLGGIQKA